MWAKCHLGITWPFSHQLHPSVCFLSPGVPVTTSQCPDWAWKHSISLAATSWLLSAPQKLTEQNGRSSGRMRRKVRATVGPPNSTCSPQVLKGALPKCSTFCLMATSNASQRNTFVSNIPCQPISGSAKHSLSFILRAVG